jgi:protein TonB
MTLLREPAELAAGGGGTQLDAISVTLVSSSVLEARTLDRLQPTASAAAVAVEADDGADSTARVSGHLRENRHEVEDEAKTTQDTERTTEAAFEVSRAAQDARLEVSTAPRGGAAARGDAVQRAKASAPAAAGAGVAREYARHVSLALNKAKPKSAAARGTAKIRFVISPTGSLASVELTKSSGSKRLDDLALAAVRRAAFPVPPPGMTVAQLTYEVPYHFR